MIIDKEQWRMTMLKVKTDTVFMLSQFMTLFLLGGWFDPDIRME